MNLRPCSVRLHRRFGPVFGVALACGPAVRPAAAQTVADHTYVQRHDFSVTPGGNVTPKVTIFWFEHAWLDETLGPGHYLAAGVEPPSQDPGFDLLGTEAYANGTPHNFPRNSAPPVPCAWGSVPVPDTGKTDSGCITVVSPNSNTWSTACTDYLVAPYGLGTPVQGYIRAMGGSHAVGSMFTQAYAFSATSVLIEAGTKLASGQITWSPWTDIVHGSSLARAIRKDPITISWNGKNAGERTLFDADFNVDADASAPTSSWSNDTVVFGSGSGEFHVFLDPKLTNGGGSALLRVDHGVVVISDDDGIFDGLLPAIGTPAPVAFRFPVNFNFGYDVTPLLANATTVRLDMGGGGGGPAVAGCRADVDGSGFVDTDDYDFFVGLFAEGGPAADFDGSGFVDLEDFSAFVSAFESGC